MTRPSSTGRSPSACCQSSRTAANAAHPEAALAFNDELARAAAKEAGCAWYFSIADFESALLDGIFVLKPTSSGPFSRSNTSTTIKITAEEMARYSPITVDLTKGESGQYTVKPSLNREASPSSVIG